MATGYIRYQKLQKCYLGQPIDPPEYKKGDLISDQIFTNLDVCENIYLWKPTDQIICTEDNSSSGIGLYKPLYASKTSPVSVADAVAGDKVFYRPTQNDIVISKDDIDGASLIGYVVVPASHRRYGVSGCCGIMMPLDKVPKKRYSYDSSFYWNRYDFQISDNHNVFYNEAGYNDNGRLIYPNPYDLTEGDPFYTDFWNGFYPNPERDTEYMWQNMRFEDSELADVLYNLTTDGTSKRSWYLPSVYEILYIYAKQETFGITTDRDYLTSTITTHDLKSYILVNTLVNGELNLSDKYLSPEPGDRIPANNGFIIPFAKLYQI